MAVDRGALLQKINRNELKTKGAGATVIFVNRFFFPDHSATSQMLSDLTFELAARGFEPIVITSRLSYEQEAGHKAGELAAREIVCGVTIIRVATTGFGRAHLVGRSIDYVSFYLSAAWTLWRTVRAGNVVVAKTDPPMLSVVIGPVAWLRNARFVNWLQDIFPETATALGLGKGLVGRIIVGGLRGLRNRSLRTCAHCVVIGERMAERVLSLGVPNGRITVIHNWADGRRLVPVAPSANSLRQAWGLDQAFVVGYSGNLGRAHEIATLVAAIEQVETTGQWGGRPIVWLFIGGGAQTAALKLEIAKRGLTSVRFEPYQSRDRLAESLSVADIHLVSLRPELEGLIVPSKFYGIAAAGRPTLFIGDIDGEIARILKATGAGMALVQGDSQGLAAAVLFAASDREKTALAGVAARRAFEAAFDLPRAVVAWEHVLLETTPDIPAERSVAQRVSI